MFLLFGCSCSSVPCIGLSVPSSMQLTFLYAISSASRYILTYYKPRIKVRTTSFRISVVMCLHPYIFSVADRKVSRT